MEAEILQKSITRQSWDEFVERVQFNVWSVSKEYVDKIIASMPRRILKLNETYLEVEV